jgi:ribosome biogenesis protein UTP30
MVKKVSAKKEQVVANDVEEVSETVKQKKENAQKMVKVIKKMNAKLKESIERKQVAKAVQALQDYSKRKRQEGA